MRIGVLTSGGDCPGLNAVIRSVVHRAVVDHGDEVIGFRDGWKGLLECDYLKLDLDAVSGILARGGTMLGSSRVQPAHLRDGVERAKGHVEELGLDAIIPIGGEGTLKAARLLSDSGLPIVGVPKTIDNDIAVTDVTFGFDTAVGVATEALDRLKTTAESHQRVLIVEVMGRHTGWIALHSGMAVAPTPSSYRSARSTSRSWRPRWASASRRASGSPSSWPPRAPSRVRARWRSTRA